MDAPEVPADTETAGELIERLGFEEWYRRLKDKAPRERMEQYKVKNEAPFEIDHLKLEFEGGFIKCLGAKWPDEEYVVPVHAKIVGEKREEGKPKGWGSGEQVELGQIRATILQVARCGNDGESLWEACDEYSQELADMYHALHGKDGELKDDMEELCDFDTGDICYINEVFVEREYRGYGLGLLAVDGLIRSLPSMEQDCFLLHPSGLTRETVAGQDNGKISERLTKYWELMGFHTWVEPDEKNEALMGLCTKFQRAKVEKVVPHLFS